MDFTQGMNVPMADASPASGPVGPATMAPRSTGMQMAGRAAVAMAMKLLERALPQMGSETPEGKALIQMLAAGNKAFGVVSPDISRAEAKYIGETANPVTTPGPEMADAIRQGLTGKGIGAAAPQSPPAMAGAM